MLYCHDENDNENATSEKKYGYRDLLLTTPNEWTAYIYTLCPQWENNKIQNTTNNHIALTNEMML